MLPQRVKPLLKSSPAEARARLNRGGAAALAAMLALPGCREGSGSGDGDARVGADGTRGMASAPATADIGLAGRRFTVELALTDESRLQGLSDRPEIPVDGGMLFVFPEAEVREFVMRRCLIPIDIAFLNAKGTVVRTHTMAMEPYGTRESALRRYSSDWPAQFAVELRAGRIAELGLKPGDKVDLPVESLLKRAR